MNWKTAGLHFALRFALMRTKDNYGENWCELHRGRAPKVGETHHQPELANTLKLIAKHGREGFYSGEVASDIVDYLQSLGGLHTLEDFNEGLISAINQFISSLK